MQSSCKVGLLNYWTATIKIRLSALVMTGPLHYCCSYHARAAGRRENQTRTSAYRENFARKLHNSTYAYSSTYTDFFFSSSLALFFLYLLLARIFIFRTRRSCAQTNLLMIAVIIVVYAEELFFGSSPRVWFSHTAHGQLYILGTIR